MEEEGGEARRWQDRGVAWIEGLATSSPAAFLKFPTFFKFPQILNVQFYGFDTFLSISQCVNKSTFRKLFFRISNVYLK